MDGSRFSPQQRAEAIARRRAGDTVVDIAAALEVNDSTIYTWLRAAGLTSNTYVAPTQRDKARAVERHLAGETIHAVASSLNRKDATVKKWVGDAGHVPRLNAYTDQERRSAVQRVAGGERVVDVANDIGADPSTLRAWRRRSHNSGSDEQPRARRP